MGVGHVALALSASKAVPRLNVGWLVMAALLSDFLLGIFATLGLEHSTIPKNFASRHYLLFTFPYSHGLLPLIVWATIFGFLISRFYRLDVRRVAMVVALVVLSHFLLDGIVHVSGLPIAGENSPKFGLGLWNHMPLELTIEILMAFAGIAIYWTLSGVRRSSLGRYGIAIFVLLVTALTWTQLLAVTPPEPRPLTISWIFGPIVFSLIAWVLDRKRACLATAPATAAAPNP